MFILNSRLPDRAQSLTARHLQTYSDMQTIDISIEPTQRMKPNSWADVARLHDVDVKTIERDRTALDLLEEPINNDVLEEIRRMRAWCSSGSGRSFFTRRNYVRLKEAGTLDEKLTSMEII